MWRMKDVMDEIYRWYYQYIYVKKKCNRFYRYMLDSESRCIMRLREKMALRFDDVERFIKNFVYENMEFEIPELAVIAAKNVIVCLMEENSIARKNMNYTKILLDHSKWRNAYKCVKSTENFTINDDDTIVPVWGARMYGDYSKHKWTGCSNIWSGGGKDTYSGRR